MKHAAHKRKSLLPAGSVLPGRFGIAMAVIVFVAFGAVVWAARKRSDLHLAMSLFLCCAAIFCGSLTTHGLRAGEFLSTDFGPTIERATMPRRFWSGIVFGYAVTVVLLAASAFEAFR